MAGAGVDAHAGDGCRPPARCGLSRPMRRSASWRIDAAEDVYAAAALGAPLTRLFALLPGEGGTMRIPRCDGGAARFRTPAGHRSSTGQRIA
ncbi:hypothetical protein AB5I41_17765 [Sphingomonas sp. MMS24-JH45]